MLKIEVEHEPDLASLEREWREAEAGGGFFQSWSWVGCLAAERFPRALLIRAHAGGNTVGLALFNRAGPRLALTECGDAARDSPYVEHNAPLVMRGAPAPTAALLLREAARRAPMLRLSGVPPWLPALAGGVELRRREDMAPWVDLAGLRRQGGDLLATMSANTRQQLRRSERQLGPLLLEAATTVDEAWLWLDALAALHTARWNRLGQAGAFAEPFFRRFHRALIATAFPRGEIEMLRLRAAGHAVGYLYNFRFGGTVHAYQSGFDDTGPKAAKPGLSAHRLAIEAAMARGDAAYDFLAGGQRYKRSFTSLTRPLVWTERATIGAWAPATLRRGWQALRRPRSG